MTELRFKVLDIVGLNSPLRAYLEGQGDFLTMEQKTESTRSYLRFRV